MKKTKLLIRFATLFLALLMSQNAFSFDKCDSYLDKERKHLQERELQIDLRQKHIDFQHTARSGQLELEYTKKMSLAQLEIDRKNIATDKTIRDRLQALEKELQRREADFRKQIRMEVENEMKFRK